MPGYNEMEVDSDETNTGETVSKKYHGTVSSEYDLGLQNPFKTSWQDFMRKRYGVTNDIVSHNPIYKNLIDIDGISATKSNNKLEYSDTMAIESDHDSETKSPVMFKTGRLRFII